MIYYINIDNGSPNYWTPVPRYFLPRITDFNHLNFKIDDVLYTAWSEDFCTAFAGARVWEELNK